MINRPEVKEIQKIKKVIRESMNNIFFPDEHIERITDALIKSDIGDVKEYKDTYRALAVRNEYLVGCCKESWDREWKLLEENKELQHRADVAEAALEVACRKIARYKDHDKRLKSLIKDFKTQAESQIRETK